MLHGLHQFHRIEVDHVVGGEPATEVVEAVPLALILEPGRDCSQLLKSNKVASENSDFASRKHSR